MSDKIYEFRKLNSTDIFPMANIINKIGFKNFKTCFESETVKEMISNARKESLSVEAIGMTVVFDVAAIILENLPKCENDIYKMLSSVCEKDIDFIKNLEMGTFFEMIIDFIKKDEFKDFMKVVSKLFK